MVWFRLMVSLRRLEWTKIGENGATKLTGLAVIIAGPKRAWRGREFFADLHLFGRELTKRC